MTALMPEPLMRGATSNFSMGALTYEHERTEEERAERIAMWAPDQPFLLGFFLPPFQRPLVWTEAQSRAFIESAWLGLHLGTYVVNKVEDYDNKAKRFHLMDRWLVDGQQRLHAVNEYLNGAFPVFGYYWHQLDRRERRRFESKEFGRTTICVKDEAVLRELYNRLNFGGVAHTEDQRA